MNQLNSKFIHLVKIIRSIKKPVFPVKTKPFYIFNDGLNIFILFFYRIGIIKSQITFSTISFCNSKIQANGFRMANMKIAIWFRWESRMNTIIPLPGSIIIINNFLNKVNGFFLSAIHIRIAIEPFLIFLNKYLFLKVKEFQTEMVH